MRMFAWYVMAGCCFIACCGVYSEDSDPIEVRRIRVFLEWAGLNGIRTDAVAWPVDFRETGRGGIALKDINDGDAFLRVPLELCIRNESAVGTPLEPITRELNEFDGLVAVLIREVLLDRDSKWSPYLNVLPLQYDLAERWTMHELDELHDDNLKESVVEDQVFRRAHFQHLRDLLSKHNISLPGLGFELYSWAHAAASTRCFELNATAQHVLVPFADLLNHHPQSPTVWDVRDGAFTMRVSGGGFEKGTQVFNNYGGDQSNWRMLTDYGFFRRDPEWNKEKFFATDMDEEKQQLWANRPFAWLFWRIRHMGVLRFFRLVAAATPFQIKGYARPRSIPIERRAAQTCVDRLRDYVASRATSIAQDVQLLADIKTQGRHRIAIEYRLERKRLFLRTQTWCQRVIEQVVECIPQRVVVSPKYFKRMVSVKLPDEP